MWGRVPEQLTETILVLRGILNEEEEEEQEEVKQSIINERNRIHTEIVSKLALFLFLFFCFPPIRIKYSMNPAVCVLCYHKIKSDLVQRVYLY